MPEDLIQITKAYYNSNDADSFYYQIWGGEDIHIGIYEVEDQSIKTASRITIIEMVKKLGKIEKDTRILDIGSGYGGAARYLAQKYNCQIDCLNLSEIENEKNIDKNEKAGLDHLIQVRTGNFEEIPFQNESFDIVWSQDALLHSNKKQSVFNEVTRILKPGGQFIFTDPMQSDNCPKNVLEKVLERIHLEEMGTVKRYKELAIKSGLVLVSAEEMPDQLEKHYIKVLKELNKDFDKLVIISNESYLIKMKTGLQHWIEASKKGFLNWGILQFQKG